MSSTDPRPTLRAAALLAALLAALGCDANSPGPSGPSTPDASCPQGTTVEIDGRAYCILIEEGFLTEDCPPDQPFGYDLDGAIVCSDTEGLPDDLRDELERRGLIDNARTCGNQSCEDRGGAERCLAGQSCLMTCSESGCLTQCEGDADCVSTCSGGGCIQTCLDQATCTFSCSGGGCTSRCAPGASCDVTSCSGGGCTALQANIPAEAPTCGAVCDAAPDLLPDERACLLNIWSALQYDLTAEPACDLEADPTGCDRCAEALELDDADCRDAFASCLGRQTPAALDVGGGEPLTCPEGAQDCLLTCPAGRCEASCAPGSSCLSACSGGRCKMRCDDGASCSFACSGGQCLFQRTLGADLTTSCSGGGCYYETLP